MQENLFYGGEIATKATKNKGYYWVTTRLLRESGPWYSSGIHNPEDVCNIMHEHLDMENADKEYFVAIYLDRKGGVLAANIISIGSLSASIVHPREVFKTAIMVSAASIIVCHNHPSGDPAPSKEDIAITKRLCDAGEILGIKMLDHVIVGVGQHVSLKEKGLM